MSANEFLDRMVIELDERGIHEAKVAAGIEVVDQRSADLFERIRKT